MHQLNSSGAVIDRIQIDRIVTRSIHIRDAHVKELRKNLRNTKKNGELAVTKLGDVTISGDINFAISKLCGRREHHSTTDPFFLETAYNTNQFIRWEETDIDEDLSFPGVPRPILCSNENSTETDIINGKEDSFGEDFGGPLHDVFVIDKKGQVTNILPAIDKPRKSGKAWTCDDYCREVDVDVLMEVKDLFESTSQLSYTDIGDFISHFDTCTSQVYNKNAGGHPFACYAEPLSCKPKFLELNILSYHFPYLRTIKRYIRRVKKLFQHIQAIGSALEGSNLIELKKIRDEAKIIPVQPNDNVEETWLDEDQLHQTYANGIKAFKIIDIDPPRIPCISCKRLCPSKYTSPVETFLEPAVSDFLLGKGGENEDSAEPSY
ncbi:hypothetical protein QAD02_013845 [Eretmocerus hayati]|uniref:Uncharacterized protein n=1 Tax=Eretmocerus hayati TaxID=131215 RepID=A0ACC2P4L1_9HYME|nr:hypothetical protein QAD02_013845 [Eretmocerus hayati]